MKWAKLSFLVVIGLLGLLFSFCHSMTPAPGSISGNGNPALIFILPIVILLTVLIALWRKIFRVHQVSERFIKISATLAVVYIIAGFMYYRIALNDYKQVIYDAILKAEGQVDLEYVELITSGLSIHVNNQHFNLNTFLMCMCAVLLMALYSYWIERAVKRE